MRKASLVPLVFALAAPPLGSAQLYRWVDENGRVEWRDTPPPANAKQVEQRKLGTNTIQTSTLPYSVQQAMRNFPVTLWVYDCGETCTIARAHLARRGVPHTERNAQKDIDALKKLMGGAEVPVLVVGNTRLKGYLDTQWDAALDAAGYPRTPPPGMKPPSQSAPANSGPDGGKSPATGVRKPAAR